MSSEVDFIIIRKDGNAWIAHGKDFTDLQESNNYAFGDTPEQALKDFLAQSEVCTDEEN